MPITRRRRQRPRRRRGRTNVIVNAIQFERYMLLEHLLVAHAQAMSRLTTMIELAISLRQCKRAPKI